MRALALEHPPREPADHLEALLVDVVQHELAQVEPFALAAEARDQLRRIGRPGPNHRELHPFTPVRVTPSTKARWARKKSRITGAITISVAAMVRFHCTW